MTYETSTMKQYFFPMIAAFLFLSSSDAEKSQLNMMIPEKVSVKKKSDDKLVRIFAKPDSISLNVSKTAVIVVDMQNDFGSKGGMFDRAGIDISMIEKVVTPTAKVLAAARMAGVKIIYLKMGYHKDLSDLGSEASPNRVRHLQFMHVGDTITAPNGFKSRILIRDSWGTEIVAALKPQPGDMMIYKTRFSGFYKTELDSLLKQLDKKYLIMTGCTTSICVESTVRDAMFRDYSSIVLEDCTAEPIGYGLPRSNHEASLLNIQSLLGWVSNSAEFIKAITELSASNDTQILIKN